MNFEREKSRTLVPVEQVAVAKDQATDKSTRKMISQIQTTLQPRFPVEINGSSLEYGTTRFARLKSRMSDSKILAALLVPNKEYQLPTTGDIELISGMCLFGASGLIGVSKSGKEISLTDPYELQRSDLEPVVEIKENSALHLSEAEAILRISRAVEFLRETNRDDSQSLKLNFHLPISEYKLYMVQLFQMGVLNHTQVQEMFFAIERRAMALKNILQRRVGIPILASSPLDSLGFLLERSGGSVSLEECISLLKKEPLFAQVLQVSPPKDFKDINNLSYVMGYLSVAKRADQSGSGCLAVEIAEEKNILNNAVPLSETIGKRLNMAAMFLPPSTVSLNGRYNKQAPFMHIPDGESSLSVLKTVIRNTERTR